MNIYDVEKKYEIKHSLRDHQRSVRTLKFSANSQTLISSGEDIHINLTDIETMKRKVTVTGHSDWVTSISIADN